MSQSGTCAQNLVDGTHVSKLKINWLYWQENTGEIPYVFINDKGGQTLNTKSFSFLRGTYSVSPRNMNTEAKMKVIKTGT